MKRLALALLAGAASIAGDATALDLQGHRGARGLYPENTLPAFATALSIGVTTLEFDVGVTKDGAVIVAHDRRLNPDITRDPDGSWLATGHGPTILGLTLAELARFDVGAIKPDTPYAKTFARQKPLPGTGMPTLRQVAELAARAGNDWVRFNIETKLTPMAPDETVSPERFAEALIAELRALGLAGRATIQSFDWRTLAHAQRIAPAIPTVYLTIETGQNPNVYRDRPEPSPWLAGHRLADHGGSLPRTIKAAGGAIWSPFFRNLTQEAMREAQALGLKVVVWTLNERADIERMIALGVDGIIGDYPDLLRELAQARGLPVPPATPVGP